MPILLLFPALMFAATMTAMGQVAMQTFPVPVDHAKARRRAFKVIKGGQQVVLTARRVLITGTVRNHSER